MGTDFVRTHATSSTAPSVAGVSIGSTAVLPDTSSTTWLAHGLALGPISAIGCVGPPYRAATATPCPLQTTLNVRTNRTAVVASDQSALPGAGVDDDGVRSRG